MRFSEEVVKLKNVWVAYSGSDRPAMRNINLTVSLGKLLLITGPNGAGKTTLIETCLGLLKPYRGSAYLFGVDTRSWRIRYSRKMCGFVPQDFMKPPFETYTVRHVIRLGFAPYKSIFESLTEDENRRIQRISELLEIEDLLDRPIGTLSGGQQQRAVIARALARRPKALFLDEPFSSLDREGRKLISSVIREYVDSEGASVIIVSHDVNPIIDYADIVIKMENGRIISGEGYA
ncbi:metal ABC transporter ATP-binding protein [Candidatus Bathyarchaeota archaeon]|nr:MAG: metal ABC transporter ATP-binding protein [Candidatus Bathyarchaeota archaeon]